MAFQAEILNNPHTNPLIPVIRCTIDPLYYPMLYLINGYSLSTTDQGNKRISAVAFQAEILNNHRSNPGMKLIRCTILSAVLPSAPLPLCASAFFY